MANRRESTEFEKLRFKMADKNMRKMSKSDIKKIKDSDMSDKKVANKVLADIVDRKFKEAGNEAAEAMGGYKNGGKVCKLATKGKGRAYGKNS
jgi:hypothetical protein